MHYNKLRRFIENKPKDNNELFEALNKIQRFTLAVINSKTQTIINIFLNNFLTNFYLYIGTHLFLKKYINIFLLHIIINT